ncbi:PPC domain-containing DNA-binding protein [Sporosarcina obsidiansis]|uniref:PPC domain-containing DNA-binding protein n=1 Tax=Sporosarcina obsidiansis TaxID=2660748 RepID=UPI00129B05DE|nr:PPC domain-containing DNA-binding protein [Sporosarcina obsidiansis]
MDNRIQAVYDSQTNRIIGRLKKDIDLFEGIIKVCNEYGIEAAQFQCMGSLAHATFVQLNQKEDQSLEYSNRVVTDTPVELLTGTGFVGYSAEGELEVHFHGLFVDCHKNINGGHFIGGENPIAITVEFIVFPLLDVDMQRRPDEISGIPVFHFLEKE